MRFEASFAFDAGRVGLWKGCVSSSGAIFGQCCAIGDVSDGRDWNVKDVEYIESSLLCGTATNYQNHPCPVYKTFSTRFAAEAFVAGWEGAGRHSMPVSRALRRLMNARI